MSVVIVAWILVLVGAFGLNHARDVVLDSRTVRDEVSRHQLRAWARSGVSLARFELASVTPDLRYRLVLPGADNPLEGTRACGEGRFVVGSTGGFAGRDIWLPGLADEAARLPVAVADSAALDLLPGMTSVGIARILQARRTAGDAPVPPFETMPLDDESLTCARRYLTRFGRTVNLNTASAEVLRALGLPTTAVGKLMHVRNGRDGVPGTADDRMFSSLDSATGELRECRLNSEEAAILAFLTSAGRLTTTSDIYSVAARGWAEGHDGVCEIRAVLAAPPGEQINLLAWTENWLE